MKKGLLVAALGVALAGCGAASVKDLRTNPDGVVAAHTDMPWPELIRLYTRKARECYANMQIDRFDDTQTASLFLPHPSWPEIMMLIDIEPDENGGHTISGYWAMAIARDGARGAVRWAEGFEDCRAAD
jgi:hypothetical protein